MKKGLIIGLAVVAVIVIWAISTYNGLVKEQQKVEEPFILICIHVKINNIRKLQHLIKKILKEIIFTSTAESGFNDQTLITASQESHNIPRAIRIINALKDHLIPCYVFCVLHYFREDENAFPLQLF